MNLFQMYHLSAEKRSKSLFSFCLVLLLLFTLTTVYGQQKLEIVNGNLIITELNKENQSITLISNEKGQAKLIQKNTTVESDSTIYFEKRNFAQAIGHVYINQDDSIDVYANRANYYGNEQRAELIGEVALLNDVYSLQTERLDYDLKNKIATYKTGGELSDTSTNLTSKKGTYYVGEERAVFQDSVVLINPERRIETEKLTYNLADHWAYFEGPTTIYEKEQTIKTTAGKYNSETGEAVLSNRPEIIGDSTIAQAEIVNLDQKSGLGEASGEVYLKDLKNNSELFAQHVKQINEDEIEATGQQVIMNNWEDSIQLKADYTLVNQKLKNFFARNNAQIKLLNQEAELIADSLNYNDSLGIGHAMGRPFLSAYDGKDSIYIVAKLIKAIRRVEEKDSLYDFSADRDVLLYNAKLQARADSAYYNQKDSIITLYKNPVIWSDSTQMSADTIKIYIKEEGINKVEFRQNAFMIQWIEKELYNQLRGREIDAYFEGDNKLKFVHTNGNAETIFIVQDDEDGSYVAYDKMKSGKIDAYFKENKMEEVFWYNQQEGKTTPFQEGQPEEFRFSGFLWRKNEQPHSKEDLLSAIGRIEGSYQLKPLEELKEQTDDAEILNLSEKSEEAIGQNNKKASQIKNAKNKRPK